MVDKKVVRKNILIITSSFPFGMSEAFLTKELEILSDEYNISILPILGRGERVDYSVLKKVELVHYKWGLLGLIQVSVILLKHKKVILQNIRHLPRNVIGGLIAGLYLKQLGDKKYDHIHATFISTPATVAYIVSHELKIPWSATAHRWDIYDGNGFQVKNETVDFVRAISYVGRSELIKRGFEEEKVTVHRIPVVIMNNNPSSNKTRKLIIPANLIPVKGHEVFLGHVAPILKNRECKLFLAGSGPLEQCILKLIKQLSLENHVELLGFVPQYRLHDDFRKGTFDAVILPSLDLGNGLHEGVPASLIEAISLGVPILAANTGSIPELFLSDFNHRWLFDPLSGPDVQNALNYLLSSNKRELLEAQRSAINTEFFSNNILTLFKRYI